MANTLELFSIDSPRSPSSSTFRQCQSRFRSTGPTKNPRPSPLLLQEPSIEELIKALEDDSQRNFALQLLTKIPNKSKDFAAVLWFSFSTARIVLKEITEAYKPMSAEMLTMEQSTRTCNAITLLQFMAADPKTRPPFLKAQMVYYLFPFLRLTNASRPYEYLRLSSLGVIGALVKSDDPEVISYLLDLEGFPLFLRCLETGDFLSKTVASFILRKILCDEVGIHYCCGPAERFFFISRILARIFDRFLDESAEVLAQESVLKLLKNIICCYLKMSECPRAQDALSMCLPTRFGGPIIAYLLQDDPVTLSWVEQTIMNVANAQKPRSQLAAGTTRSSF